MWRRTRRRPARAMAGRRSAFWRRAHAGGQRRFRCGILLSLLPELHVLSELADKPGRKDKTAIIRNLPAYIRLQEEGVENINLVTPTQYIFPIVSALGCAYEQGLNIPVVYNTSGYDVWNWSGFSKVLWTSGFRPQVHGGEPARRYSHAANYPGLPVQPARDPCTPKADLLSSRTGGGSGVLGGILCFQTTCPAVSTFCSG